MNDDIAKRMVERLCLTPPFARLPVTNRPMENLWLAVDQALMALRLPLYFRRLGKSQPKPAAYEIAIQTSLAILEAFAATVGTRQAVLSSEGGRFTSISFQPRPYGVNWTAEHALTVGDVDETFHRVHAMHVEVSDMLHLAAKVTLAITRCKAGWMVDAITTFTFDQYAGTVSVLVREIGGREYCADLIH